MPTLNPPFRLIVGANRGSEVFGFDEDSRLVRLWLRTATVEWVMEEVI